jgi:hypothetical protein
VIPLRISGLACSLRFYEERSDALLAVAGVASATDTTIAALTSRSAVVVD